MQAQCRLLIDQELFDSAEKLGALLLCATKSVPYEQLPVTGKGSHAESLLIYSDALFGKGEYKRALAHYKQAMQRRKVGPHMANRTSPPSSSSPSSPGYAAVTSPEEAHIKFKEAQCYKRLDEVSHAIRALEAVSTGLRTLPMNLTLGSLYMSTGTGSRVNAMTVYQDALRQNPVALEAINALVSLGVSARALLDLIKSSPAAADLGDLSWIESYVVGLFAVHTNDHGTAIQHWSMLEERFPNNLPSLLQLANLHLEAGRLDDSHYYFNKARVCDTLSLDYMDRLALLLKLRNTPETPGELNRLAHDLLSTSTQRPETWVAIALYTELRGDREKALHFVEKALLLSPRHVLALQLKGGLLVELNKPEHAIISFFHAKELRKDLRSYKGLVDAYINTRKLKEAMATAKEAIDTLPNNAGAVTLLGRVLAAGATANGVSSEERSSKTKQAKKVFGRALVMDPDYIQAAMALVDLLCANNDYAECIELLQQSLRQHNQDFLHTKLADVLSLDGKYSEALASYHTAMALNPNNEDAKVGLEKLEKRMRGVDPDLDEDEGDGEEGETGEASPDGASSWGAA